MRVPSVAPPPSVDDRAIVNQASFALRPMAIYHPEVVVAESTRHRGEGGRRAYGGPEPASGDHLPADELHVWSASLERPPAELGRLRTLLAADERERAGRFRFERDRSRFIAGRGLLRILLGRYLGVRPAAVELEYGEHEKPRLRGGGDVQFNLSHSGTIALYALSSRAEVGIDIELDRPVSDHERLAERFFSPNEVAVLRSLPERQRALAFLTCWTRKEAFIKARGDGLSLALSSFDVSLIPGLPAAVLRTEWSTEEPGQWRMADLSDPSRGYVAAVARKGDRWRVIGREIAESGGHRAATEQEKS